MDFDGDLFGWANQYVRATDPETSQEAAATLDPEQSAWLAYAYFREFYSSAGLTGAEYEQRLEAHLLGQGWKAQAAFRRAESLRRRLTCLHKKYHKICVRPDLEGKLLKRDKRQIYFLV